MHPTLTPILRSQPPADHRPPLPYRGNGVVPGAIRRSLARLPGVSPGPLPGMNVSH